MKPISRMCKQKSFLFTLVLRLWIFTFSYGMTAYAQEPPAPSSRITIALLPFADETGDPQAAHWSNSLPRMIAYPFRPVKALRVCDGEATLYGLRKANLKPGQAISSEQAKNIGETIEARRVVWGEYRREGKLWQATARVIVVSDGTLSPPVTATSDDWLTLTQQLADKLLNELAIIPTDEEKSQMKKRITSSPEALESYSRCYQLSIDKRPFKECEQMAIKAIEHDPQFSEAYLVYGSCLLNQGKMKEGHTQIEKARQLNPEDDQAHLALGLLCLFDNNSEEAIKFLQEAARLNPDETENFLRLAEYYVTVKENDKAIAELEKALLLDPVSAQAHGQLGWIYARMGKKDQAVQGLQKAVMIAPDETNVYQMTSLGYDCLGMTSLSIEHREKLLSLSRKIGLNPEALIPFEKRLQELRASLQLEYVVADEPQHYSAEALRKELRERLTKEEFAAILYPLDCTPAMKKWALELTKNAEGELQKARALYDALAGHLDSGSGGTLTAQQVFDAWQKPGSSFRCQEYARLYVALAREVGLKAYFTEVDRDHKNEPVLHACAGVFISGKLLLVDPSYRWFGVPHKKFSVLNDYEAVVMQMNQGEGLFSKQIAVKLKPDALSLFNLAGCLIYQKNYDEAKKVIERFLKTNPDTWMTHYARGSLAWIDKKWDVAEVELQKSIEIYPGESSAHYQLGLVYMENQKLVEAREAFRSCLSFRPALSTEKNCRHLIAMINEIQVNPSAKNIANPKERWRQAVLHESTCEFPFFQWNPMVYSYLGLIYDNRAEPKQFELVALRKQAAADPDHAYCRFRIAMLLSSNLLDKESEEALREAESVARRAVKKRPDDIACIFTLICTLRGSEEALQLANHAIKVAPMNWQSWKCLSQYQSDLFLRKLFVGLENLPPHGFDLRRTEEAFFLRSNSQAECLALLKLANDSLENSRKSMEVSSSAAEAIVRHLACMANLDNYRRILQELCGVPLDDRKAMNQSNVELIKKAILFSQDDPEMLAALGLIQFSTLRMLAPRNPKEQENQAAWLRLLEESLKPVIDRLLQLADHRDTAIASAAYEGFACLVSAHQGYEIPIKFPEISLTRLEKACAQTPHRLLLWDLRLFHMALQVKALKSNDGLTEINSDGLKAIYPIAVARSQVIESSRSHAIVASTTLNREEEIAQWKKAIEMEPDHLFYSLYLVSAMMRQDSSEKALAKALELLQETGDRGYSTGYWKEYPLYNAYRMRLFVIHQLLSGKTEVAERALSQLLTANPADSYALRLRKAIDEKP